MFGIQMGYLLVGLVVIATAVVLTINGRQEVVCKDCGFTGLLSKKSKANFLIGFILLCFFIIPGIIYLIWGRANRRFQCPTCSGWNLIPTSSPVGQQLKQKAPAISGQGSS